MKQQTCQNKLHHVAHDQKYPKKMYEAPCLIKLIEQPQSGENNSLNENTNGFIES